MKPQLIALVFLAAFLISSHAYNWRLYMMRPHRSGKRESILEESKRTSQLNLSGIMKGLVD